MNDDYNFIHKYYASFLSSRNHEDVPYALGVAILKQVVGVVREVIILYVYLLVIFTPYYYPSPPPWKVVENSMPSCWYYLHYQKCYMPVSVRSLL